MNDRNLTPSDLAKLQAKFAVSQDVIERSLCRTNNNPGCQVGENNNPRTPSASSPTAGRDNLPATKKRIRQSSKPLMNKLESQWFAILKAKYPGTVWYPQALQFRLANGLQYRPDAVGIVGGKIWAWEVKGPHAYRGGFENLKMAASTYPEIRWVLVWKDKTSGQWCEQEVLS